MSDQQAGGSQEAKTSLTSASRNESQPPRALGMPLREHKQPPLAKSVKIEGVDQPAVRKATGPRTPGGKQRSKSNALKHGILSKGLLLKDESRAEYDSLLKGLQEDWKPQGTLETILVENLATLLWRKRRVLQAESAEIAKESEFIVADHLERLRLEAEEHERLGETSGGMLRHSYNPFVLNRAMTILTLFRTNLEAFGFQDKDPWMLRKLYGLDLDQWAPLGLFHCYLAFQRVFLRCSKAKFRDDIKKDVLSLIDNEIKSLKKREEWFLENEDRRAKYKIAAAVVPPQGVAERLLRYETHLCREIDRSLSQLERLQRMRLGQPLPPALKVEVSR